jgi:adenylosuccinate synthase
MRTLGSRPADVGTESSFADSDARLPVCTDAATPRSRARLDAARIKIVRPTSTVICRVESAGPSRTSTDVPDAPPAALRQTAGVPATVVVGAQWGDEGKGKIVDLLAQRSDVVCRYQGGPNAGHTIVVGDETYKIRATPSGVISGKISVIGGGCVVDPEVLIGELEDLEARGIDTSVVVLSGNAHLIMPWHIAIDQASERRLGKLQIGTTRRGIGPCYADKASRIGIRVQDILDPKILRQKIEVALAEKNVWLERVYEVEGFDLDEVATRYESYAQRLRPIVGDASLLVHEALKDGKDVLFEGAQATLLDLDHGTYPFVTSSNPIASGAATGIGIGPTRIDRVLGVAKAYVTRVGEGPFPSEISGPDQARLRDLGGEFGTVTGRVRRCGWLDLVALRYAVRVNGITSLALTKLDVLSDFAELPVCIRYRLPDGSETPHFPAHQSDFHHARPVWENLAGWLEPLDTASNRDELPVAARSYVEFVERELEVPVELVGVGAGREHVLA